MNINFLIKKVLSGRKGDRLVNAGIFFIAASMIGGYNQFIIEPLMQVFGVIAGILLILIGVWFSHTRSKFKPPKIQKKGKTTQESKKKGKKK